jgi:hypothetical protein
MVAVEVATVSLLPHRVKKIEDIAKRNNKQTWTTTLFLLIETDSPVLELVNKSSLSVHRAKHNSFAIQISESNWGFCRGGFLSR